MTADKPPVETLLARCANFRPMRHPGDPWKYDGTWVCDCGTEFVAVRGSRGAYIAHRAHVAQVINDHHAAELARAWDEGATAVSSGAPSERWLNNPYRKDTER